MSENEFELDGKKYVAKIANGCEGCAFDTCHIISGGCGEAKCHASERSDSSNVIFIEVTP